MKRRCGEKMVYIGIDPGKNGGYAVLHEHEGISYGVMGEEFVRAMRLVSSDNQEVVACVEKVGAMPGQGVVSMFNFGKNAGFIEGVLHAFAIPYQLVTPQKWKREFGLTGNKEKSIEVCKRLFPNVDLRRTERCKKEHDGMAEALLMAEYARRKWGGKG